MEVKTIRDLVDWVRTYHHQLQQCYTQSAASSDKERIKILLDYFAAHEKELEHTYQRVLDSQEEKVLNSWCAEYSLRQPKIIQTLKAEDISGLPLDAIVQRVLDAHHILIDMYTELVHQAQIDDAKQLFESLLQLEKHQLMQEMVSVNRFQDI